MEYFYDLHIHSSLSPCCDNEMTPNNIVNMALLKGLQIISVTDHNTMLNVSPIMEIAKKKDILVVPGIEVSTKEEVHVLCYFRSLEEGLKFQNIIYSGLPDIRNKVEIFGNQWVMDSSDNIVMELERLLISSTKFSINEVNRLVMKYNGALVPAHINKKSNSILYTLGFLPTDIAIGTIELSARSDLEMLPIDLRQYNVLTNSDAHYLQDISEPLNTVEFKGRDLDTIVNFLR